MSQALVLPQPIRAQLAEALLSESDILEFLRQARLEPVEGEPERRRCRGSLAVRRALDPETAQLVDVEIVLERRGDGWLVVALSGLGGV